MNQLVVQILTTVILATNHGSFADDLSFTVHRSMQGLEIFCSISNVQSSSFTHLDNLVISYQSSGSTQVLASVSSYYGHKDPISHVPAAEVSGSLSSGEKPQGSLLILWVDPDPSLDGRYLCEIRGADVNFMPKTISKLLQVEIGSMCPCFAAEPEVVKFGLTKELEVTCFLPNPSLFGILELASLAISRSRAGVKQIVAEINPTTGPFLHQVTFGTHINGSLNRNMTFLKVKWDLPSVEMATEYICEGSGVSTSGNSTFFTRQVSVANIEPSRKELVDRLMEMYTIERELKLCKESLDNVTNAGTTTATPLTTLETTSATTITSSTIAPILSTTLTAPTATTTLRSTTSAPRPSRCEDLQLPSGQHVVTLYPKDNLGPFDVLCDVVAPGDIWTVFQKRFNGGVDFYRNFSYYDNGFGSLNGEFWLGLANTRRLLLQNTNKNLIRFELKELTSSTRYNMTYKNFYLGPANGYRLNIDDSINDGGYGMSSHVGQTFSTYDHGWTTVAGRGNREAGWWFPTSGGYVNINSRWGLTGTVTSMFWYQFRRSWYYPLGETTIKFQKMS